MIALPHRVCFLSSSYPTPNVIVCVQLYCDAAALCIVYLQFDFDLTQLCLALSDTVLFCICKDLKKKSGRNAKRNYQKNWQKNALCLEY